MSPDEWQASLGRFAELARGRSADTIAFLPSGFTGFSLVSELPLGDGVAPPFLATTSLWEQDTVPSIATAPAAVIEVRDVDSTAYSSLDPAPEAAIRIRLAGRTREMTTVRSPDGTLISSIDLGAFCVRFRQVRPITLAGTLVRVDDVEPLIDRWLAWASQQ